MGQIKCVIFDFGDTLVDSTGAIKKAQSKAPEQKALAKHGHYFSKNQILNAFKKMQKKALKLSPEDKKDRLAYAFIFLKELGLKPSKKLAWECQESFYAEREKYRKLMPNALGVLKFLKRKKIMLCVITNTATNANRKHAKQLGIKKYFKQFIMSHEFGSQKSELEIFHHLLEKINKHRKHKILPADCLMVGNHAGEDGAAKLIGMKTAIYTKHLHGKKHLKKLKPDFLLNDLKDLERIVK